jgi:hypothetical protein
MRRLLVLGFLILTCGGVALAQCATPSGTTLSESFGNTSSGSPCWPGGPSSCNQPWNAAGGAVNSIVPSPGAPGATMACADSLQMAETPNTFGYIYTTGSFPTQAAGSAFDVFVSFRVSSQSLGAYHQETFLCFGNSNNCGSETGDVSWQFDGTQFSIFAEGLTATSHVAVSLNAWHSLHVHFAGGANGSYFVLDNGLSNFFTELSNPTNFIIVGSAGGASDPITYAVGYLDVDSTTGGGWPPSVLIDNAGALVGGIATTATINSGTHCGNGTWTYAGTPGAFTYSSSAGESLLSPQTLCDVVYTGNTGVSLAYAISTNPSAEFIYTWKTLSSVHSASFGFGFQFHSLPLDTAEYAIFAVQAGGNDFAAIREVGNGAHLELGMECKALQAPPNIPIVNDNPYWATVQYNAGGTHLLSVYNITGGVTSLVGTVSCPSTGINPPLGFSFGRTGSETPYPPATTYFWNMMSDYMTAQFPLGLNNLGGLATQTTLSGGSASSYGQTVNFTATVVTSPTSSTVPVGSVIFFDGQTNLGTAVLDGNGNAVLPVSTLAAGTHSITATYTAGPGFQNSVSTLYSQVVNQATPVITWTVPAAINYGTPLSSTQLNATANVPGTFAYNPPSGAVLAPGAQTLSVTFTPTDATDYKIVTASASLQVNQGSQITPTIVWAAPAPITYGTALSSTQLNATATFNGSSVSGSFVYSPAIGVVLSAGLQNLSVTFTPTNTNAYTTATGSVAVQVNQATPKINWSTPAAITYGSPLSDAQLNATSSVAGTFIYSPVAGTVESAGSHTLSVTFNPTDSINYQAATAMVALVVNQAATTTTITSNTPNPSMPHQAVRISVSVAGNGTPSGPVTVVASSGESCRATVSSGVATCSLTFRRHGTRTVQANYGGDINFTKSSSANVSQTVE